MQTAKLGGTAGFDPAAAFTEFRLPGGRPLVLCRGCELEEFTVSGGWGFRLLPGKKLPVNTLQRVRAIAAPRLSRDKFCPACNHRLAFAEVITDTQRPDRTRPCTCPGPYYCFRARPRYLQPDLLYAYRYMRLIEAKMFS